MDILVCTQPDRLLHKQGKLENDDDHSPTGDYYWHLANRPKQTNAGDKIYFATQGIVRGYFLISSIEAIDSAKASDFCFNCSTWKDVAPTTKIKGQQGFRYFDYEWFRAYDEAKAGEQK